MSELNLKEKFSSIKDFNLFNNRVATELEKTVKFASKLFLVKLSCGNENPPMKYQDIYLRAVSILRYLTENPQGCSKIRNKYSRMKKNRVKPVKRKPGSYFMVKEILSPLEKEGLISKKDNKGYYTTLKGKELLLKHI